MRGRGKRDGEGAFLQAWTREALAREKRLKPAEKYLKRGAASGSDGVAVAAKLKQMAKEGGLNLTIRRRERKG